MELSPCVTDADYEAWRSVRIAVLPYERCSSVAELRAQDSPDRVLLLARDEGRVVGSGMTALSESADSAAVAPRVLPEHRRRGVGSALLVALAEHATTLGVSHVRARVDDEEHLGFAGRFGFTEVDREVEQSRRVDDLPSLPAPPPGLEVVVDDERPGLWEASFESFGREVLADLAVRTPLDVTAAQWAGSWRGDPVYLALHDGEVVGCAGLLCDADQPRRAEHSLTAVRRDWRGRGLAAHLKIRTLEWAATHDVDEVYTWTQDGNAAMRGLNERLGYRTSRTSVSVSRPLPLP